MLLDAVLPKKAHQRSGNPASEKHWISLVKGISWRIVGTIDTMLIAYFITGHLTMALSIGFVEIFTKITLYYLHERAWILVSKKWKAQEAE